MAGHVPTIYLRNVFQVKRGQGQKFLEGKKRFIEHNRVGDKWILLAAFGQWPLLKDGQIPEPGFEMVQIWRVKEWSTLYDTMIDLSETEWYRDLHESLISEDHELLVNANMRGATPLPRWLSDDEPGYMYVYELVRPCERRTHAYLRDVNWFDAKMSARYGWDLAWCGSQITSQPAAISLLWRIPQRDGVAPKDIARQIAEVAKDPGCQSRYEHMMSLLQTTERRILFPIYSERLAQP